MFDLGLLAGFGLFGYADAQARLSGAPLILGLVLGDRMERALRQSLMMSGGTSPILVSRPMAAMLLASRRSFCSFRCSTVQCMAAGRHRASRMICSNEREEESHACAMIAFFPSRAAGRRGRKRVGTATDVPIEPIDFLVHTGPGGGSDLLARAVASDDREGEARCRCASRS